MRRLIYRAVLMGLVAILSACGGGGGGDSSTSTASSNSGSSSGSSSSNSGSSSSSSTAGSSTTVALGDTSSLDPVVALDDTGNAFVAWSQGNSSTATTSGASALYLQRYVAGSGWQPAQTVVNAPVLPQTVQIATDPVSGRAMLIWEQFSGSNGSQGLYAQAFDPASGWGPAMVLDASNSSVMQCGTLVPNGGLCPDAVGLDGNGTALVVWAGASGISANRYVFGTGWGTPANIGSNAPIKSATTLNLQLNVSSTGDAAASWSVTQWGGLGLIPTPMTSSSWINSFTPASGWGTAVEGGGGLPDSNGLIVTITNSLTVASVPSVPGILPPTQIWANYYNVADNSSTNELVYSVTVPSSVTVCYIAVSTAGSAAVAWMEKANDNSLASGFCGGTGTLQVSAAPPGGPWSAAQTLSSSFSGNGVELSIDDQGNVQVVWIQPTDSGTGIWASSYSASSGAWTASQPLPDFTANNVSSLLSFVGNGKGDAVLAWIGTDNQIEATYQSAGQ